MQFSTGILWHSCSHNRYSLNSCLTALDWLFRIMTMITSFLILIYATEATVSHITHTWYEAFSVLLCNVTHCNVQAWDIYPNKSSATDCVQAGLSETALKPQPDANHSLLYVNLLWLIKTFLREPLLLALPSFIGNKLKKRLFLISFARGIFYDKSSHIYTEPKSQLA